MTIIDDTPPVHAEASVEYLDLSNAKAFEVAGDTLRPVTESTRKDDHAPLCGNAHEESFPEGLRVSGRPESITPEIYDTEHFRIHYALEGEHAFPGGISSALFDRIVESLELSYEKFLTELGMDAPPGDGAAGRRV